MRVELIIDELVLTGFDPRDRHRIADALEGYLAAELSSGALEQIVSRGASRDANRPLRTEVSLRAPHRPGAVAEAVSRAVIGALGAAPSTAKTP